MTIDQQVFTFIIFIISSFILVNFILYTIKIKNLITNLDSMKKKRIFIKLLQITRLRCKKDKIPQKDSIRPMKVKTIYPEGWTNPKEFICKDGTKILYGFTTFFKKEKLDRIPCSDSIDNSY